MSIFTKMGEAAAQATNEETTKDSPIVSFKSGTTYKVGVKSINDCAEYFGYGIYGKVNTFVPEKTPTRNAKGYVTANPSVWDKASDLLYADAKAAEEAGAGEEAVKEIRDAAYALKGKKRYLRAFYDLTSGQFIAIDISPAQEGVIKNAIEENIDDLDVVAFKLSKKGTGRNAVVSLSPIVKAERDLTAEERENFAKIGDVSFDLNDFETCLFVADEAEQVKNLVKADFDIGRLGLSVGGAAAATTTDNVIPIVDDGKPIEISEDSLPF